MDFRAERSGPELGPERRLLVGENPFEDGFLGVQAVFRFVPDDGGFAFHDLVGHFLAAMGGQAVQELAAGGGELMSSLSTQKPLKASSRFFCSLSCPMEAHTSA